MEDIQVGEYIRTKQGYIHIVKSVHKDMIWWCDLDWISEKDIVKHSKNIIDLIEVGDLIHIILPADKYCDEDVETIWHISDEKMLHNIKIQIMTNELKLLDIVTKEQFNSVKYEVER